MKFSKLFLAFFIGSFTLSAQTYMPDDNFESWCEASGYGDGVLDNDTISSSAASFIPLLAIDNVGISDLTGLEAFTALTNLNCARNQLSNIDISFLGNNLTIFNATNNNADLYCITVFDTSYAANQIGFFQDSITSYSTNCLTAFGCTDSLSCNYEPTYSIDTTNGTSCYYSVTTHDTLVVCDSYLFGDTNRTVTGSYTNVLTTVDGCDSNVVLALTIRNSTASYDTTSVLVCDSYIWNNVLVDISGDIEFSAGLNVAGCDSTAWLHAIIEDSNTGSSSDTSCDTYTWEGQTITSSGDLVHTYTNAAGCDSTHTLSVTIYNSYNEVDAHTDCNSFTWIDGITYTSSNNTADSLYQSINGCDSLVTLNLILTNSASSYNMITNCDSYTWINGTTYDSSGLYFYSSVTSGGCSSLDSLDLTINYSNTGTSAVTGCDSFFWEGQTITTSGDLVHTYTNTAGCDSTHTLSVTINYSTSGSLDTTVCSLYTNALGNDLDTTAIYTFVLTNSVGCDSVVTLNLTVNYPDNSLTTDSACESYTWNGITYTTTDTYYFNTQTVLGCDSVAVLDLFVGYNEINTTTVTTCDNYAWVDANGDTIITALNSNVALSGLYAGNYGLDGYYIDTVFYTNQGGCDSIEILNLTLTQNIVSSSQAIDIFACDGWMGPDGNYYTTTGIANIVTGTTLGGCDSLQPFNINIAPEKSSAENVVACDSYTWIIASDTSASSLYDTIVYNSSGVYAKVYYVEHTFSGDSIITCDSIAYLHLAINPSTTSISNVNDGCDSYLWNGTTYDTSGVYTFATTNFNGCDSTATLNLTINYTSPVTIDTQVFCDSIYTWINGETYSVPVNASSPFTNTTDTFMLQTVNGCDSLIKLDLTIYPSYSITLPADTFCDSYDWILDGTHSITNITASGLYTIQFSSINGCDSLISLDFTIDNSHTYTDTITACDSFVWIDGLTYTASNNTATHMYQTVVGGCDSLISLALTINYSNTGATSVTECDSYPWDGVVYTTTGAYTNTYTNVSGCDSVHTLNLTINYSNTGSSSEVKCDSYIWAGSLVDNIADSSYTVSGIYTNTYTNVAGCDSVHTLNLTIDNTVINYDTIIACYEYTWQPILYLGSPNDWTFDTTSTFNADTNSLTKTVYGNSINSSVCTDISNLYLTINPLEYGSDAVVACDSYLWEGNVYSVSGVYVDTIAGTLCDSIATLTLTINNSTSSTDVVGVHCDEFTWIDGVTYTTTDNTTTYTDTNSVGCDSIITLDLVIVNSTDVFVDVSACDSYYWAVSDTLYSSSGIHSHTYAATNSVGCDSTIWITLTINNSSVGSVDITACDDYAWDGVVYDSSGSYTNFYIDANGCDSSMTLNLTITTGSTGSLSITACDSYDWDGVVYDSTGSYTNLYSDTNGCDSIVILSLTINNSSSSTDSHVACDSFMWFCDGNTYTSSNNTAFYTYTNSIGCDSIVTLDLTINNSSTASVSITACDSYLWDGVVYDSTGSYTNPYTNVNGCDSSMTLNLTIANGSTGSVNITACDDFAWDGVVYDSTGSYTNLYTDLNGCDSSMTLNLTIATGSSDSINITVCDDFTWDGIVYDSTGSYTNLYTDLNGCDSVVTLNLTITTNGTSSIDNVGSHCDSYTWIDGVTYTVSNSTATMTYTNVAGCDSVITLNLIINDELVVSISSANTNLSAIVTGGIAPYSYLWTGPINSTNAIVTPIVSGDYCVQVTDAVGCVSSQICENVTVSAVNDLDVSKFNIYPNPTTDFLTLDFYATIKGNYSVKIISSNGEQVYEDKILDFNGDYSKNINLSNLAKGNYIIQIHSDHQVVYRKILLQ